MNNQTVELQSTASARDELEGEIVKPLRVYEVSEGEWYCARSRDEAIALAIANWGCSSVDDAVASDMLDLDDVMLLTDEQLDRLKYVDGVEDEEGEQDSRTFREELARRERPELFAMADF